MALYIGALTLLRMHQRVPPIHSAVVLSMKNFMCTAWYGKQDSIKMYVDDAAFFSASKTDVAGATIPLTKISFSSSI